MPYDTTLVADRHLLDGVARGEADALRALHQRYGESIYALVYGVLVDPGEAEEVVAETFAHLWRTAARFVATTNQSVRSEEHTSELQSQSNLVCRLLLEKKKNKQ